MIESKLYLLGDRLRQDIASQYTTINSGGCALFALMLGEKIRNLGYAVTYSIVSYSNDSEMKKIFLKYQNDIVSLNENSISIVHVFVKVDGMLLDCKGAYKDLYDTSYANFNILSETDSITLVNWIKAKDVWNAGFHILKKNKKKVNELLDLIINDTFEMYQ